MQGIHELLFSWENLEEEKVEVGITFHCRPQTNKFEKSKWFEKRCITSR